MAVSKTIGAAGFYATFAAFNSAQSDFDKALFLDAIHTEAVTVTKVYFLEGDIADRGVTLTSATTTIQGTTGPTVGSRVTNLHVTRTGTGITVQISAGWTFTDVAISSNGLGNSALGALHGGSSVLVNVAVQGASDARGINMGNSLLVHCSVSGCNVGINLDGNTPGIDCLCGNNTTDFTGISQYTVGTVSEDGTGDITGFDPDDWTDKTDAKLLTIRDAVKLTTVAYTQNRFPYPFPTTDAFGNTRPSTTVTAGWHEPNSVAAPVPTTKVSSVSFTPSSIATDVDFTTPAGTVNKVGIAIATSAAAAVANAVAGIFTGVIPSLTASTAETDYNINTTDGKTDLSATTTYHVILVVGDNVGFAVNAILGDEDSFTTTAPIAATFQIPIGLEIAQTNEVRLTVRVT